MFVKVTPELQELVEACIREFIHNPIYSVDCRAEVAQVHALPLLLDMGGCFALRPNGEIVKWPWDAPKSRRARLG